MRRMAIGCVYDAEGIIDEYKLFLINSIQAVAEKIIIISNGRIQIEYEKRLLGIVDNIYYREDIGADAGAFKDYFCNRFEDECWKEYDEIIVFNDSCYGPFEDWNVVFDEMDKEKCDYWGMITTSYGKERYLNPYFNVYKIKNLREDFVEFWQKLDVNMNRCGKLVYNYEIGMQNFFEERGYKCASWMEQITGKCYDYKDLYRKNAMLLNGKYKNPLLKYKMFSFAINPDIRDMLTYLEKETDYDINMIQSHLVRIEKLNRLYPFSENALKEFVTIHRKIYIFGHGEYGKNIEKYCNQNNIKIDGFVVTSKNDDSEISLDDLNIGAEDGIIVGVGMTVRDQVEEVLINRFNKNQLLLTVRY